MVSLIGSWVGSNTANSATLTISVTGDAPAGSRLVLATNKTTSTNNGVSSITDTSGNTWTKRAHSCRALTHDMAVYECMGKLVNGDTVTVTFTEVSTRKTAILSAWSGVGSPNGDSGNAAYGLGANSVGANGSSATESVTTTGSGLVIAAFSRATAATLTPVSPVGIVAANTVITAAGSSDRGLSLAWYMNGSSLTATGTLSASQGWTASSIALPPSHAITIPSYTLGGVGGLVASFNIDKPAGTVQGDLLLALVNTNIASSSGLTASGFTLTQVSSGFWIAWKIAGASEGASYTFTRATSPTQPFYAVMLRITGHDPSNPIETSSGVWATSGTSNASIDAPSVTVSTGKLLISTGARSSDVSPTVTPPAGMAFVINDTSHANSAQYVAIQTVAAGATGVRTWSYSGTGSNAGYAVGNIVINAAPPKSGSTAITLATGTSATGTRVAGGTGAVGTSTATSASGQRVAGGTGAVGAATSVTADGARQPKGSADITTPTATSASGAAPHSGSASLALSTGTGSDGEAEFFGTAVVGTVTGTAASGEADHEGTAALGVTTGVSAAGLNGDTNSSNLPVAVALSATGAAQNFGSASLSLTVSLLPEGNTQRSGSSGVPVALGVAATGEAPSVPGTAEISTITGLLAAGSRVSAGAGGVSTALAITAAGEMHSAGVASLEVSVLLSAEGENGESRNIDYCASLLPPRYDAALLEGRYSGMIMAPRYEARMIDNDC